MISIDFNKITNVTEDSREVDENSVFVAIKGFKEDGHKYIKSAIDKGAKIIVCANDFIISPSYQQMSFIKVAEPRIALSEIAATIYTPKPSNIVAITGTNGKTSVAYFFQQIIHLLRKTSASVGTLGVIADHFTIDSKLTTPSTAQLHKILQHLSRKKIDYVALEASSHGLHQHRLDHIKLKAAAITNFSHEHLDYHHTMDEYFLAKMSLFSRILLDNTFAIINADIKEYKQIASICTKRKQQIISYGYNSEYLKITLIEQRPTMLKVNLYANKENYYLTFPNVTGDFQAYNIMCAIGLVIACGFALSEILPVVSALHSAPGRMQKIENSNIFIDYSHKPEALEKALQVLRGSFAGKLIVVFGCGGDRDQVKRPIMGEIADKYSDLVIVTDDNPRNENPQLIRDEILKKCPRAIEISNREHAIEYAVKAISSTQDVLLIAGKGHEAYQIVGDRVFEFDDYKIAKKYLQQPKNT